MRINRRRLMVCVGLLFSLAVTSCDDGYTTVYVHHKRPTSSQSGGTATTGNHSTYSAPTQWPRETPTEYQWQQHEATSNPVQPHQVTEDCHLCWDSGRCNTCNGTRRINYQFGAGTLDCPNCSNGRCSSCGGSGKKTKTVYY